MFLSKVQELAQQGKQVHEWRLYPSKVQHFETG